MKCHKVQNLLPAEILGDLDGDLSVRRLIQEHLLGCAACAAERIELARTIGLIRENKETVVDAYDRIESSQRHSDSRRSGPARRAGQRRELRIPRQTRRWPVYAAAASVLLGVSVWLTIARVESKDGSSPPALAQTVQPLAEVLTDRVRTRVPSGAEITTANERKIVLIDGLHEMVLGPHTRLRVARVEKEGASGPLIRLTQGEILTQVEHTGRPFVVSTSHGQAVITGTTFVIQTDDRAMDLMVVEGSVRLESSKGQVHVGAGFASTVGADGAPTPPRAGEMSRALARVYGGPAGALPREVGSDVWGDLTDLWLTASSGPIRLEAVDYRQWVNAQRAWFAREFPWVFRWQDSLAQEGQPVEFPRLLVASGDIRQFVFPDTATGPVAHFHPEKWQALSVRYEITGAWPMPAPSTGTAPAVALTAWATYFRQAERAPQHSAPDILMRSLRAGTYLVNTRTLLWLYLWHEPIQMEDSARSDLLGLLHEQVRLGDGLTRQFIHLLAHGQHMPCEEQTKRYRRIADDLIQLRAIEERVCAYEIRE